LLTVTGTIPPMRCTVGTASGTVLWSVLLPASRETVVTDTRMGQGGGVRQVLPLRRDSRAFVVGVHR
jgi:hypothetical protein